MGGLVGAVDIELVNKASELPGMRGHTLAFASAASCAY
jgi:hypothetical protein